MVTGEWQGKGCCSCATVSTGQHAKSEQCTLTTGREGLSLLLFKWHVVQNVFRLVLAVSLGTLCLCQSEALSGRQSLLPSVHSDDTWHPSCHDDDWVDQLQTSVILHTSFDNTKNMILAGQFHVADCSCPV